jgi:tRNA-specific 2-thiouridylase
MKAIGLLSGGLDSTLAAKLMIEQGVEVVAVNFVSPFCTCTAKGAGCASVVTAVRQLGNIPLQRFVLGDEYLAMVRAPKYGYGSNMNPCIDCRIMKIRKAAEYMREIGASFLFTGEVLGQRPKSQHRTALHIIDRDSGISGLIVRPLSAKHLDPTIPEQQGWLNRDHLLNYWGRSRKPQIALAANRGITEFACPAGGCLLTDERIAERLRDYFEHTPVARAADMPLLRVGRHFRLANGDEVIVARDEREGEMLERLTRPEYTLLAPVKWSAPAVLLKGTDLPAALGKMLEYVKKQIPDRAVLEIRHGGSARQIFFQDGSFAV